MQPEEAGSPKKEMSDKHSWAGREADRRQTEARKRELLVLIAHHLAEEGEPWILCWMQWKDFKNEMQNKI